MHERLESDSGQGRNTCMYNAPLAEKRVKPCKFASMAMCSNKCSGGHLRHTTLAQP